MQRRTVQGNAGIPLSSIQAVFDIAGIVCFAYAGAWFIAGGTAVVLLGRWIMIWFIRPPAEHVDGTCLEDPGPRMGEALTVNDGGCIPADGRILQGVVLVDESSVTGESRIQERRAGDVVFGGSLCKAGSAVIRVMRSGPESMLGKNEALLSEPGFGTKAEQWIRACGYTAFVVGAITSLAVGFSRESLILAGTLLIASGGADLATRIAPWVRSALRKLQQHGAVLKTAAPLETLAEARGLLLHKSELVPLETYAIVSLDHVPHVTENFVWESVAIAEKHAEQAVERLLYREAVRRVGNTADPERFHAYPGRGIWVRTLSREILMGNVSLFAERGVQIPEGWQSAQKDSASGDHLLERYVAANGACIGRLRISVRQHEGSKKISEELETLGIRERVFVSSDSVEKTGRQAEAWNISHFHPAARPDDVWRELEQLMKRVPTILVGDGISDSQSMLRADLGIIPDATGTAVIRDTQALVLLSDRLNALPKLIRISQAWLSGFRYASVLWLISLLILWSLAGAGIVGPVWIALGRLIQAMSINTLLSRKRLG